MDFDSGNLLRNGCWMRPGVALPERPGVDEIRRRVLDGFCYSTSELSIHCRFIESGTLGEFEDQSAVLDQHGPGLADRLSKPLHLCGERFLIPHQRRNADPDLLHDLKYFLQRP